METNLHFASKLFHVIQISLVMLVTLLLSQSFAQYEVDWEKYMDNEISATWTNDDFTQQVAIDVSGSGDDVMYVVGETGAGSGTETIANCNSSSLKFSGDDAFLAKYDKCGHVIWLHYFGVDLPAHSYCMARAYTVRIDKSGGSTFIYVAGIVHDKTGTPVSCYSTNCMTAVTCTTACSSTVFQPTNAGNYEGFIAKYDDSGNLLKWTYFGGNDRDYIFGMDIIDHNVLVCGFTENTYAELIPLGAPHYDATYWGAGQAFVAAFDPELCQCIFFSYLGGANDVRAHDIKGYDVTPPASNIGFYLSGTTSSALVSHEAGITYNLLGNSFLSGTHAWISHWKADGTTGFKLDWVRYLQGDGLDRARQIVLCPPSGSSARKDAIVVGSTNSTNILSYSIPSPITTGLYQSLNGTEKDAYVMRFRSNGTAVWGTYYGGTDDDDVGGVDYSSTTGLIGFAGNTRSTDLPVVNPIQSNLATSGQKDSYLALLTNPSAATQSQTQPFATYLGGTNNEYSDVNNYFGPNFGFGNGTSIYYATYTKSKNVETKFKSLPNYYFNTRSTTDQDGFLTRVFDTGSGTLNCTTFVWKENAEAESLAYQDHGLVLTPNPAQNSTTVVCPFQSDDGVQVQLIDALGNNVFQKKTMLGQVLNSFDIDVSNLPEGFYFVRVSNGERTYLSKLLVQ